MNDRDFAARRVFSEKCRSYVAAVRRAGVVVVALWCALAYGAALRADDEDIEVEVVPWAAPEITEFDPKDPPADLPAGEDADATASVEIETPEYDTTWEPSKNKLTVTSVGKVKIQGGTTIRQPTDATQDLKDHERGHDALSKNEYERSAAQKIKDAFRGFKGMMFFGEGATDAERKASALAQAKTERDRRGERARDAILQQLNTLGEKYDRLTDHGKGKSNDPKKKEPLDTNTGKAEALAERNRAPAAGAQGARPSSSRPLGSTAPDPAAAFYLDDPGLLTFGGDLEIFFTRNPGDSILGRGRVEVDPMVLIGPAANGSIHLSDTALRIVDLTSGELLMNAFLFEVAYMSSSLPGFAGMVQAYLDIPPEFAGGIDNFIGSDFLSEMQAASTALEPTTFWFFADAPLFDAQGNSLIGDAGVEGSLKLGVAEPVPEPTGFVLLGTAAAGLAGRSLWRRRRGRGLRGQSRLLAP